MRQSCYGPRFVFRTEAEATPWGRISTRPIFRDGREDRGREQQTDD